MNLRNFLKEIDRITESMSKEELQVFVHENGRRLPETVRQEYLETLMQSAKGIHHKNVQELHGKDFDFRKEFERLNEQLRRIAEGEVCLGGELNYEYDDWYDGDEDEFILSDPNGVVDIITEACGYVHKCVDCEEYRLGYQIAEALLSMEINVEIEDGYDFYDELGIGDLGRYDLGYIDGKGLVIDGLYCVYQVNSMKSRADALYRMIENSGFDGIRLEMVMQRGEELADVNDFLPVWIKYLGEKTGRNAQALLEEALELGGKDNLLLESARLYSKLHPSLYEQYLDSMIESQREYGEILKIGDEALEKIEEGILVRSHIAKKLGLLALEHNLQDRAELYWLEAFRSDTNVTNFMRLFMESSDGNIYLKEVRKIYQKMYKNASRREHFYEPVGERKTNCPDIDTVYMLAFLGGEFQYVKEHAMNVSSALGWSSTFMKCGLAAFLLLLYDGQKLQNAGREMCRRVVGAVQFDKEDYGKYAGREIKAGQEDFFWQCFLKWKEKNTLNETEKQAIVTWLEKIIKKRVKGIMEANRRNYYGECASFIAAFGETLESLGEAGAKQRILVEYKTLYSRRSAFHQELRAFGMMDVRKRK